MARLGSGNEATACHIEDMHFAVFDHVVPTVQADLPVLHADVAGVRIGVEEAVDRDLADIVVHELDGDLVEVVAVGAQTGGDRFTAIEPISGQGSVARM